MRLWLLDNPRLAIQLLLFSYADSLKQFSCVVVLVLLYIGTNIYCPEEFHLAGSKKAESMKCAFKEYLKECGHCLKWQIKGIEISLKCESKISIHKR